MKRTLCHAVLAFGLLLTSFLIQAQVSINNAGTPPNSSAMLDVSSTTKGIMIPSMTQAQRDAIVNPATGLLIYQTDFPPGVHFNIGTPESPDWFLVGINAGQWITEGDDIYYSVRLPCA